MRNLWLRIITALVLIPLVFAAIFWLPANLFPIVCAAFILSAAWEWSRLAGCRRYYQQSAYVIGCGLLLLITWYLPLVITMALGTGLWIIATIWLIRTACSPRDISSIPGKYYGLMGLFILPICWQALNFLCLAKPRPYLLLILFLLVWIADTIAYFAGSRWGKHKLAPKISPGKTVEGALAGIAATMLGVIAVAIWRRFSWQQFIVLTSLALITVIAAIVGDLFESLMKRTSGVKDSSHLLPGHGGILDRIDSLTAAAPVFALGMLIVGMI